MESIVFTPVDNKYTASCPEALKKFGFKDILEFFPEEEDEDVFRCTGFISGQKYIEFYDEIEALIENYVVGFDYSLSFHCSCYSKKQAETTSIVTIDLLYSLVEEDDDEDDYLYEETINLLACTSLSNEEEDTEDEEEEQEKNEEQEREKESYNLTLDWTPAIMRVFNKNWTTPVIDELFKIDEHTEFIQEGPGINRYVTFAEIKGLDLIELEDEIKDLVDHPIHDDGGNVITFHVVYESVTPEVYFDNSLELYQLYDGPNSPDFSSDDFQVRLEARLVPAIN